MNGDLLAQTNQIMHGGLWSKVAAPTASVSLKRDAAFARTAIGRDGWIGPCEGPLPAGWATVQQWAHGEYVESFTGEIIDQDDEWVRINVSGPMRPFPKSRATFGPEL